MKFCTECGYRLNEGASFCGGCGTKIAEENISPEEIAPAQENAPEMPAPEVEPPTPAEEIGFPSVDSPPEPRSDQLDEMETRSDVSVDLQEENPKAAPPSMTVPFPETVPDEMPSGQARDIAETADFSGDDEPSGDEQSAATSGVSEFPNPAAAPQVHEQTAHWHIPASYAQENAFEARPDSDIKPVADTSPAPAEPRGFVFEEPVEPTDPAEERRASGESHYAGSPREKVFFGKAAFVFCLVVIALLSIFCGIFAGLYVNEAGTKSGGRYNAMISGFAIYEEEDG